jgi:hypothetical protein
VASPVPKKILRRAWRSVAGGSFTRAAKERILIMDMKQFVGEHFLKVADLNGEPIQKTIAIVKQGKYDKANVVFEDGDVLGLNVTNTRCLLKAYGDNSTDWIGKTIELYVGQIEVRDGDIKDAILVRPISPPLKPEQRTKLPPAPAPEAPKRDPGHPFNDPVDL